MDNPGVPVLVVLHFVNSCCPPRAFAILNRKPTNAHRGSSWRDQRFSVAARSA